MFVSVDRTDQPVDVSHQQNLQTIDVHIFTSCAVVSSEIINVDDLVSSSPVAFEWLVSRPVGGN